MSPSLALQNSAFLFYSALAASLLGAGGIVLAALRWVLRAPVSHAWMAYCGWLCIVPVLLIGFFLGRETVIVLLNVVSILAFREFARSTELAHDRILCGCVYLGIGSTGIICLMTDPFTRTPGWYGLFMALPILVVATLLSTPVVRNTSKGQLSLLALAVMGYIYFGWMFGHLAFLANSSEAYSYLGYLVFAVAINDIAAYVVGKSLGRRLLCSNISPKKTWEGAIGGLIASLILPWALLPVLPNFGFGDRIAIGLIVGIGGQVGDLVISVIKRDRAIKDMGSLIPGHGGILDRIDSLIYVAPLFFYYIRLSCDLER
jgi:phosphatidate cytidylyltransferase